MDAKSKYTVILVDGERYDPWKATGPAPSPATASYGLSNLNRYGGHTSRPLSVAEHSIWMALYLACGGNSDHPTFRRAADGLADRHAWWISVFRTTSIENARLALLGLVHDVPEGCGLVDVPSPIGRHAAMDDYKEAHERAMAWICKAWGLDPPPWPEEVKAADSSVLGAEMALRHENARKFDNGEHPPWPGLDLVKKHNLNANGANFVHKAWLAAFNALKIRVTVETKTKKTKEATSAEAKQGG